MKTKEQIEQMLEEYENMLNREENQNDTMQIKLWAYIHVINRILNRQ